MDVTVGLREGSKSWQVAEKDGLPVKVTADAVKDADVVMVLIPDELQAETYKKDVEPNLKKGAYLGFAHGFNVHFKKIVPPADVNVFMVAPKGPGHLVRRTFQEGSGVPSLYAVEKDPSGDTKELALAWAPVSAPVVRASWAQPSAKKQKPICSVNKPFFAAVSAN